MFGTRPTILLLDDRPNVSDSLASRITALGYRARVIDDLLELRSAIDCQPEAALVHLGSLRASAILAAWFLRTNAADTEVMVYTGNVEGAGAALARHLGLGGVEIMRDTLLFGVFDEVIPELVQAVRKGRRARRVLATARLAGARTVTSGVAELKLDQLHQALDKHAILLALEWKGGNVTAAAAALGLERSTFKYRMEKLDIDPDDYRG